MIPSQTLPEKREWDNTSQLTIWAYFMNYYFMISKPDKGGKKWELEANFIHEYRCKNPKAFIDKLLKSIRKFRKLVAYKINMQNIFYSNKT